MNVLQKTNAPVRPLHKDVSFWIVAVVLVGAASAAQLYFGVPWFSQRLALVQPAPRSTPDVVRKIVLPVTNAAVAMPANEKASQTR